MFWKFAFVPTLKILDINVDSDADSADVRARPKGILAFLASLIGMGKVHNYHIDAEGWQETTTSATEEAQTYVPWAHVSASVFKVSKPLALLISGILLAIAGLPLLAIDTMYGLGPVAIGLIEIVVYFLSKKKTTTGIIADSGTVEAIHAEATKNQEEWLRELSVMIQKLVRQGGGEAAPASRRAAPQEKLAPPRPAAVTPAAPATTADTKLCNCPHCDTRMKIPASAVGKRVTCPSCQQPFVP